MRKIILTLSISLFTIYVASAQYIVPSTQFGVKGGANITNVSKTGNFNSGNETGYLGGMYARFGSTGFIFEPELYMAGKNISLSERGYAYEVRLTTIDVPLLVGARVGEFGVGGRFYTGPLVSFIINDVQNINTTVANLNRLDYKKQNFAWQLGAGLDIQGLSIDVRYEMGLSKQMYGPTNSTKMNVLSVTLSHSIFTLD